MSCAPVRPQNLFCEFRPCRIIAMDRQQIPSVSHASLVPLGFVFRYADSDKAADQSARSSRRTGTSQRRNHRPGSQQGPETRNCQGSYSDEPTQSSAENDSGNSLQPQRPRVPLFPFCAPNLWNPRSQPSGTKHPCCGNRSFAGHQLRLRDFRMWDRYQTLLCFFPTCTTS
jgi:hypothetical protein